MPRCVLGIPGIAMALALAGPIALASDRAMAGTVTPQSRAGQPLPGLSSQELNLFVVGQTLYNTTMHAEDGLGPAFNKPSCGNCHNSPLGGPGSQTVTRFGRVENGVFDPLEELGGSLLQQSAIGDGDDCFEFVPKEANVTQSRVTNGALAYGLVEAIRDEDLEANQQAQPVAQQGVIHYVGAFEDPPGSELRVGRFGWKAQVATVMTFSADAALNEMGLTNDFLGDENAPNGNQQQLELCDLVADPEDQPDGQGFTFVERVTHFQRFLAPFPQTPKSGMTGETVFNTIGCAVCHTPSFTTSDDSNIESALRDKTIRPYSDFLLHYMGATGDPIVQGAGVEGMIKTPPLWGLRHGLDGRDPMWHNGLLGGDTFENRVRQAIAMHNPAVNPPHGPSQGAAAAQAFDALTTQEQDQLIAFLASLGRAEFDADHNNIIDINDFLFGFRDCYSGPGNFYTPDDPCAIHDIDQDGDVDMDDVQSFLLVYVGPRRDCNNNGQIDLVDILLGAADANFDGVLDSCEPTCDADINGGGAVNVVDLLAVINQWGACPPPTQPCGADIDFNQVVNVQDMLMIINAWGTCP